MTQSTSGRQDPLQAERDLLAPERGTWCRSEIVVGSRSVAQKVWNQVVHERSGAGFPTRVSGGSGEWGP